MPGSSVNASGLAGRYALALFELARDRDALETVATDLANFRSLLHESLDLGRLIRSPVLSRDDQGKALNALGERVGFQQLTAQFLGLLAEKRRLFVLPAIIEAYEAMLAEHKGEVGAELVSAVPLTEAQIGAVREQLETSIGKDVTLVSSVDPNLLGGLVVRVGSRMIDASLRTKLHQLEMAMRGAA